MSPHIPLAVGGAVAVTAASVLLLVLSAAYTTPPDDTKSDVREIVRNAVNPRTMFDGWKYPDDFLYMGGGGTGQYFGVITGPSAVPAGIAAANNALAVDLYGLISADGARGANILYSPAGVYVMLSMLHEMAAGGQTATQIRGAVGSEMTDAKARAHAMTTINRYGPHVTFDARHALWLAHGLDFAPWHANDLGAYYYADLGVTDFAAVDADGSKPSVKRINQWASDATRGMIGDTASDGDIGNGTLLVATSTAYLEGAWAEGFLAWDTKKSAFVGYGGATDADFMNARGTFGYHQADGAQILGMPYVDGRLSMLVVLPRDRGGLERVEAGLYPGKIAGWIGMLEDTEVGVSIPKFEISAGYDLAGPLAGLNVTRVFDEELADMSGLVAGGDGGDDTERNLHVSLATHGAYMRVDEAGSYGAASGDSPLRTWVRGTWTAEEVVVNDVGGAMDRVGQHAQMRAGGGTVGAAAPDNAPAGEGQHAPPSFVADRPFMFAVYDDASGAILLMGRISDFVP